MTCVRETNKSWLCCKRCAKVGKQKSFGCQWVFVSHAGSGSKSEKCEAEVSGCCCCCCIVEVVVGRSLKLLWSEEAFVAVS